MTSLFLLTTITLLLLTLLNPSSSAQNDAVSCPLNFTVLRDFVSEAKGLLTDVKTQCQYIRHGLQLVESTHLQLTNSFLPPLNSSESCWVAYESLIDEVYPDFNIRKTCGFETEWISNGCMNITLRSQFETLVTDSAIDDVVLNCNQSLENNSPCASCVTSLSSVQSLYLTGSSVGNLTDCAAYPAIYAAAFANHFGPPDKGTAQCLFSLDFSSMNSSNTKHRTVLLIVILICSGFVLLVIVTAGWFLWRRRSKYRLGTGNGTNTERGLGSRLDSIGESSTLIRFDFEGIKKATRNFSRDNIIGRGGYGNVYRGVLLDGTEVAMKRFKNCSVAGDVAFSHEVEVIASVRHFNPVALRGYCTATTQFEGHYRVIVCDLMKNGSLHDHLFGNSGSGKLSWLIRQKIALGTARGLSYLHYGAQLAIIHRDIRASNILLDEKFEAKVADLGLAKFTPEGMTHLSTNVAGTMGYVAPEYALYGQLTERSDVYSFGVVLLELLSGKKALGVHSETQQPTLITDWAWSLVKNGRIFDVIENGMPEMGVPEVMEKYVMVAILCSHTQLYARPAMDQVVKMLETEVSVPSIPERPIPIVAGRDNIESSFGSGQLSSPSGYQSFIESDPISDLKQGGTSSSSIDKIRETDWIFRFNSVERNHKFCRKAYLLSHCICICILKVRFLQELPHFYLFYCTVIHIHTLKRT